MKSVLVVYLLFRDFNLIVLCRSKCIFYVYKCMWRGWRHEIKTKKMRLNNSNSINYVQNDDGGFSYLPFYAYTVRCEWLCSSVSISVLICQLLPLMYIECEMPLNFQAIPIFNENFSVYTSKKLPQRRSSICFNLSYTFSEVELHFSCSLVPSWRCMYMCSLF